MTNNFTTLHSAARGGWLRTVISHLDNGEVIDAKNIDGDTPLLLAAENKYKDIVECLINAGADIHCSQNWNDCTVLHHASRNGWLDIVQYLLNNGADIFAKDANGDTPLIFAAAYKHKDIVECLVNAGADINCSHSWDNCTVLHYATENGWLEVAQLLLKKGVDIIANCKSDASPLLVAARNKHQDIVELIINAGAALNSSDLSVALLYASSNGWIGIVQSLLHKGADMQVKTHSGATPLHLAADNGHEDIVKLLINAGADINCSGGFNDRTVLHYASQNGWLDIVESLLKKGADIEAKTNSGKTSLQIAFYYNKIRIIEYLINAGADINVDSCNGNSPLSNLIRRSSDIKLIRLLIKSGAYFQSFDYERVKWNSLLNEQILLDIKLCSQAIINKFNHKDLPELYKLSMACKVLPRIENMTIGNNSQVAHEMLQNVNHEIQVKGQCNLLKERLISLKVLAVKSFLIYCDNMKIKNVALNQTKRSAEFDSGNRQIKLYKK